MNNLDAIQENVFKITDDLPLVRKYLPYLGSEEDLKEATHVHLVTASLPNRTKCLHGWLLDANDQFLKDDPDWQAELKAGPRVDLVRILKKGKPKTFDDLQVLVSFFLQSGPHNMDLIPMKPFASDGSVTSQVLDSILSKSRGWLLWQYQLDRVVAILERSGAVREKVLRDFRLARPSARGWLSKQRFDDGQSLGDVVEERKWERGAFLDPAMGFSFRLFNVLFSKEPALVNDQGGRQSD